MIDKYLLAVIIALTAIIVIQSIVCHLERKDLYTRLMCRDVSDYKNANSGESKPPISRHKEVLSRWRSGKGGSKV